MINLKSIVEYCITGHKNNTVDSDGDEYFKIENVTVPNGWKMYEIDLLHGMGFEFDGDTHMSMKLDELDKTHRYKVCKHKSKGVCLEINDRKYYFRTFNDMMDGIDKFGTLDM